MTASTKTPAARRETWTCWKRGRRCRTAWQCRGSGAVDGPRRSLILARIEQEANAARFRAVREGRARWTRCRCGRLWAQPLEDGASIAELCLTCDPPKTRRPRTRKAAA